MMMWKLHAYILYFYVSLISAFTNDQIMDRFDYIEDRLNKESQFRREDFRTMFKEVNSIKEMLQTSIESKAEKFPDVKISDKKYTMLEEKLKLLLNGFKEEKTLQGRLRREVPELRRQVEDMMTVLKQTLSGLTDILTHIESLKQQTEQNHLAVKQNYKLLEEGCQKADKNVLDIKKESVHTKTSLENLTTEIQEMKEMMEYSHDTQKLCLEKINVTYNLYTSMEENLSDMKNTSTKEDSHNETELQGMERKTSLSVDTGDETLPSTPAAVYQSCLELYENGYRSNGVYKIALNSRRHLSVYCDMKTDGGGWTVFQRRQDGSEDFYRNWEDYRNGFGNLIGEFWLGNDDLNLMTDDSKTHELRIELGDHDGNQAYAKYRTFMIGPANMSYQLHVSGYHGNAGDSLETKVSYGPHNKMKFSTYDKDNDNIPGNCAEDFIGAWWYNKCYDSNLNSLYHKQSQCSESWECIIWFSWKDKNYSLKFTEMKFR